MMYRSTLFPIVFTALASLGISACGGGGGSGGGGEVGVDGSEDGVDGSEDGGTVINTFDGNWVSSCVFEDESFPEDGYERAVLVISGRSASLTENEFADAQCQVPDPEGIELLTEFSLVYPGGSTSTARGDATHVNVTPTSFTVNGQPLTEEQQQVSAEGGGFNTRYSIFLLESGMLFLGNIEDGSGSSAANRSTQLNELGFTMQ